MTSLKIFCSFLVLVSISSIAASSPIAPAATEEYDRTSVRGENLVYEWTIENFSQLPHENEEWITSPIFQTKKGDLKLRLHLFPRGYDETATDHVSVYVEYVANKVEGIINVNSQFLILKSNNIYAKKSRDWEFREDELYGEKMMISRSDLLNIIGPEDTFTIRVELSLKTVTEPSMSSTAVALPVSSATNTAYGRTYARRENLTYEWTIGNFSRLPQKNKECITSSIFQTEKGDMKFRLQLFPRGYFKNDADCVSIYFKYVAKEVRGQIDLYCQFSILKSNNIYANKSNAWELEEDVLYGEPRLISRSDLLSIIGSEETFTIRVELSLKTVTEPSEINPSQEVGFVPSAVEPEG